MSRPRLLSCIAFAALLLASSLSSATAASPVGKHIKEFRLSDHLGTKHSLSEWRKNKAIVIVFLGVECPLAKLYASRLNDLANRYRDRGVRVVGINANSQDTLQELQHYVRKHDVDFLMLKDAGNRIADHFDAKRTPEAFLLDQDRVVRYHGRIDDQFGVGYSRPQVEREDLALAIDELLAGKSISQPSVAAVGCHIGRVQRGEPKGDITYTNQISRLLQKHCIRCHRSEQIAPFALTEFEEVQGWAETICEVMADGRMPPWHANPKHGEFRNDARMTEREKQTFYKWVENGAPKGDPSVAPKPQQFNEHWQIGEPDIVFKMPVEFRVPAKGVVPYQYFYLDTKFEKDVWIKASEVRPGNRSVVHHIFLFYLPPGQDEPNAEDPLYNTLATYAPGVPAGSLQDGMARYVPAGSRLGFQVHYTPTGSEQRDRSEVGLVFAEADEVTKEARIEAAINVDFKIPPAASRHRVNAGYHFTQDTFVHALTPHMHYRGRSFRFTAQFPDGKQLILLDVPRYDFNWQNTYVLKKPLLMPRGTTMMCQGVFDNSEQNLVNPDSSIEVVWGDQSFDEMMLGIMVTSLGPNVKKGEFPKVVRSAKGESLVHFRFQGGGEAATVSVAGSFNDWNKTRHPMKGPDPSGFFHLKVPLPPGQHEYKFVVNGEQWLMDPENPHRKGPFSNTVIRVP